jgi:hypothetical protein
MYHPLTNEDGLTSNKERREHATDLVEKIMPYFDQLTDKEQGFVEQMGDDEQFCSVKQHLWLKDIWSRFA